MFISRLNILLIYLFCSLIFNINLFAEDSKDDGFVSIESITSNHSKYITGDDISFKGTFRDPGIIDEYSIVWNFGDGKTDTGKLSTSKDLYANPGRCSPYKNMCYNVCIIKVTNKYSKAGSYTVTFSTENSKGKKYENSSVIVVEENNE